MNYQIIQVVHPLQGHVQKKYYNVHVSLMWEMCRWQEARRTHDRDRPGAAAFPQPPRLLRAALLGAW